MKPFGDTESGNVLSNGKYDYFGRKRSRLKYDIIFFSAQ